MADSPAGLRGRREDNLRHVLRRAGVGVNHRLLAEIRDVGWRAWIEAQLDPMSIPDPGGDQVRRLVPRAGWSAKRIWQAISNGEIRKFSWDPMFDIGLQSLGLQCWSSRMLYERMVDFYGNHFNVTCPSSQVWMSRGEYESDVLRRHAMGTFTDILIASSQAMAMLQYLDAAESWKHRPNENYARELLELHTVGVGNYSERDVQQASILFTGWEVPRSEDTRFFNPDRHDPRAVTILGYQVPAHAASDGVRAQEDFLRWLAVHPATAHTLCSKLCRRFIADSPPHNVVDDLVKVWKASKGDTQVVLRALFAHPDFWLSHRRKVRRPMEDLSATVAALRIEPPPNYQGLKDLYWLMSPTGHQPYRRAFPDGYPDTAYDWQSSGAQLTLWNTHVLLGSGEWPKEMRMLPDEDRMPSPKPRTPRELVDHLEQELALEPFRPEIRRMFYDYMGHPPEHRFESWNMWVNGSYPELLGLALDTPLFRLR